MRWFFLLTTFQLLLVCYGQKFDTSGAVTLNVSPSPGKSTSCGGCLINFDVFQFEWYHQAYTHVAATVVKFVNNVTNVTITSTIQGSSFTLPYGADYAAIIVSDSVITTTMGGVVYKLTYPNTYGGIYGLQKYSSTPITNGNGTVKCVVSTTALTHKHLLREYVSNGLDMRSYYDKGCDVRMKSPPNFLVRVSSLTATTTNYANSPEARTSDAKKALPSNSLSSPTAPLTESSKLDNLPTIVLASPSPQKNTDVPSVTLTLSPSGPVHSEDILGSVRASTLIATGDRESESAPSKPVQSSFLGSVPAATTLEATRDREAEPGPSKPVQLDLSGPLKPATTPTATKNHEPPKETGIIRPDQPHESDNGKAASRSGEPTPTVPMRQFSPKLPESGITETVALAPDSPLRIELSSIVTPTGSSTISDLIFSRPNDRLITNPTSKPTSLGLPSIVVDNSKPISLSLSPSILTFTTQHFTVPNPSDFSLSGTTEIHRGGSTIITSATRAISLGKSATILIVDESRTTIPAEIHIIVGSSSQIPGTSQVTANSTLALPPAVSAVGNGSEIFTGAQMKLAEVSMFIILGATFFGIAAPWGLRYV